MNSEQRVKTKLKSIYRKSVRLKNKKKKKKKIKNHIIFKIMNL